jgi:hypothetical protein
MESSLSRAAARVCMCLLLAAAPLAAQAQQLVIGQGSSLDLGTSTLDIGCRDLVVAGTLALGSGTLSAARNVDATGSVQGGNGTLAFSGDLNAAAALVPGSSTVRSQDGCASTRTRILGAHQFHRFVAQTDTGREIVFPAGLTQNIGNRIELLGGIARLVVRSSVPDALAFIQVVSGSWLVNRIDVRDVGATINSIYIAPAPPEAYDSIDGGNSPRFLGGDAVLPIPSQSWATLLLLAAMLAAAAGFRLRDR